LPQTPRLAAVFVFVVVVVVVEELRRKKGRGGVREENLAFTPA
jgi:hypothetical protein|tara:strand:+ start:248 stop:376 length:129 start_codon:yes stop_codon:yes gene_type:complete